MALSPRIIQYYSGQGRVYIGPDGGAHSLVDVDAEGFRWFGNVPSFQYTPEEESSVHQESFSGIRSEDRRLVTARRINGVITLEDVSPANLALLNIGEVKSVVATSVVDEDIGNPAIDNLIKLDQEGISSLVITDSATVPNTLPAAGYTVDTDHGVVTINDKTTGGPYTAPFLASYDYGARRRVSMFTTVGQVFVSLLFTGLNTMEADSAGNPLPLTALFYRAEILPGQQIQLIGTEIQSFDLAFAARLDTSKAADAELGQFGFISLEVPPEDV